MNVSFFNGKCYQYYIENIGQYHGYKGQDINMSHYLSKGRKDVKRNITILVNDKSIFSEHYTLKNRINLSISHNYHHSNSNNNKNILINDEHGTAVTSIIAGNEYSPNCFTGLIQSNVSIVFNSLIHDNLQVTDLINSFTKNIGQYQISSNSWSFESCIYDKSHFLPQNKESEEDENNYCPTLYKENKFIAELFQYLSENEKIIIFSAGNDGYIYSDTNSLPYFNQRNHFIVASSTNRGEHCFFSNRGTSIFVNTPSSLTRDKETEQILSERKHSNRNNEKPVFVLPSTESHYSFSDTVGGTSVSAPQLAAIIGIMLQTNPCLKIRDIKYILISTSTINDCEHYSWIENSYGVYFSPFYGFGRLNGGKAIELAKYWTKKLPIEKNVTITSCFCLRSTIVNSLSRYILHRIKNWNNAKYNHMGEEIIKDPSNITLSIDNNKMIYIESMELSITFNGLNSDFFYSFLKVFVESPQHTIANPKIISHSKEDIDLIKLRKDETIKFTIHSFFGEESKGKWNIYLQTNHYFPIRQANISISITIFGTEEKIELLNCNNIGYTSKIRYVSNTTHSERSDQNKASDIFASQTNSKMPLLTFSIPPKVIAGSYIKVPIALSSKTKRVFQFFVEDESHSNQILLECHEITNSKKYITLFIPTIFKDAKEVFIVAESFIDDFIYRAKTTIFHTIKPDLICARSKFSGIYTLIYHEYHFKMDFASHCSVTIMKHSKNSIDIVSKNVFSNTGKVELKVPYFGSYDVYIAPFEEMNISNNYFHHFYIEQHCILYLIVVSILCFILLIIIIYLLHNNLAQIIIQITMKKYNHPNDLENDEFEPFKSSYIKQL